METTTGITDSIKKLGNEHDAEYLSFIERLTTRLLQRTDEGHRPLFQSRFVNFDLWLAGFEEDERQFHNCHACEAFLRNYGSLVVIDEEGRTESAFWDEDAAPAIYRPSVIAYRAAVESAPVIRPFYAKGAMWGTLETGNWRHMALRPPNGLRHTHTLLSPHQLMAEREEEFRMLSMGLVRYSKDLVQDAVRLLQSEALYRSEKTLGVAEWLLNLHSRLVKRVSGNSRRNLIWLAVASAPPGYCHLRSTMIGTLLEDLAEGVGLAEVQRRFAAKMSPLQYQRPQVAPSTGNIEQAEKLVEKLGIARSLERRFACLEDLQTLWTPKPAGAKEEGGGVFGHLKTQGKATPRKTTQTMVITWEKFQRTVLPVAEKIECVVQPLGNYTALVTAVHADAPPILQWDEPEHRNPVSWYVYHNGSSATNWSLRAGTLVEVTAITLLPPMWRNPERYERFGKSAILILKGARDTKNKASSLFPETMRSELHGIRATIEAHSKSRPLQGFETATACGLRIVDQEGATVHVTTGNQTLIYQIDRWD